MENKIREIIGAGIPIGWDEKGILFVRFLDKSEFLFSILSYGLVLDETEYDCFMKLKELTYHFRRNNHYGEKREYVDKSLVSHLYEYNLFAIGELSQDEEWKNIKDELLQKIYSGLKAYLEEEVYVEKIGEKAKKMRLRSLLERG